MEFLWVKLSVMDDKTIKYLVEKFDALDQKIELYKEEVVNFKDGVYEKWIVYTKR